METLRLIQLSAFVAAAEKGSVTEAARELGVHRSNVSRYIMDLEDWLSRPLTTDDVPLELTVYGRQFLPIAQQVIELLNDARASLPAAGQ
ncbi:LysR family transcriptional regulator [Qipengyuania nanhaisediminis]|nr:LysR family transcriptional regulator [Qipengyuania nanhaisediminis]